jgi:hypothetical protein
MVIRVLRTSALLPFLVFLLAIGSRPGLAQDGQPAAAAPDAEKPWWERIEFGGDLRGRYEGFFQEGRVPRHRERFRLRLGLSAPIATGLSVGVRLASADPRNPTSPNQSLGEFFSRKPLYLDLIHVRYEPPALRGLALGFGKFPTPFVRTQMTWDDDLNWEGTFQQVTVGSGRTTLRVAAVQSPLDEPREGETPFMFGEQARLEIRPGRHRLAVALGGYQFRHADRIAEALDAGVLRTQNTNRLLRDPAGRLLGFASNFRLVEVIAEATLATRHPQYPLTLLANHVVNTAGPAGENRGLWIDAGAGRAAEAGTGLLQYTWARIEREAAVSAFTFSDIPGTNLRMHRFTATWAIRSRAHVDFIGFLTRRLQLAPGQPNPTLTRIQGDFRVRF